MGQWLAETSGLDPLLDHDLTAGPWRQRTGQHFVLDRERQCRKHSIQGSLAPVQTAKHIYLAAEQVHTAILPGCFVALAMQHASSHHLAAWSRASAISSGTGVVKF